MEILMNGDIYLKREPEYIEYSFEELEEMKMEKEMIINLIEENRREVEKRVLESEDLSEEYKEQFLIGLQGECDKEIEELNQKEEKLEKGKPDYNGYKNFWTLVCFDDGLQMVEQTDNDQRNVRRYPDKAAMEKEFVSLREFLKNAEYLGIEYFIPEDIGEGLLMLAIGCNGSQQSSGIIATYYDDDRAIVYNKSNNKYELAFQEDIIPKTVGRRVLRDGEFEDKAELYQAIFKQLCNNKKNNL